MPEQPSFNDIVDEIRASNERRDTDCPPVQRELSEAAILSMAIMSAMESAS